MKLTEEIAFINILGKDTNHSLTGIHANVMSGALWCVLVEQLLLEEYLRG